MYVFLDTQSINKQHFLDRPPASLLLEKGPEVGHKIVVPEVVVLEMVAHFRETLSKALADARRGTDLLQTVVRRPLGLSIPELDVEKETLAYEQWLRDDLKRRRCDIAPLPELGHGLGLVQRDLARRRPFDEKGRGLRDALLWETVLEHLASSYRKVALITGNLNDFCDGAAGTIHPDLRLDLIEREITADMVLHFETISQFVEAQVLPITEKLRAVREQLQAGTYSKFSLESWLLDLVGETLRERSSERLLREVWPDSRDVSAEVDEIYDIELDTLLPLDADALYIEGEATVRGRRGALGLPRPRLRDDESIWDEFWDDESVTARGKINASVSLALQLLPNGDVDETTVDIDWMQPAGGLDVR